MTYSTHASFVSNGMEKYAKGDVSEPLVSTREQKLTILWVSLCSVSKMVSPTDVKLTQLTANVCFTTNRGYSCREIFQCNALNVLLPSAMHHMTCMSGRSKTCCSRHLTADFCFTVENITRKENKSTTLKDNKTKTVHENRTKFGLIRKLKTPRIAAVSWSRVSWKAWCSLSGGRPGG